MDAVYDGGRIQGGGIVMEQFSLTEYLKNPDRQVVTRDGRAVRILCTDRNYDNYPVVALVQVHLRGGQLRDDPYCFTKDGLYLDHSETQKDLFFAPEKGDKHQEGWINIYEHDMNVRYPSFTIYNTEKEAKRERGNRCVATIKIEWEE